MLKPFLTVISLTFALAACGEPPITDGGVTFNQTAADKLTPEQYKKMDIEFFNYFDVKNEYGANKQEQIKERTSRMIRLAEAGFEPAWIALRLYNFANYGDARFSNDYAAYWHQLKKLADSGNSSAQCLFPLVAQDYARDLKWRREAGQHLGELPTQETEEARWAYLQAAAKQGQTYCQNYAAGAAREEGDLDKEKEIERNCAFAGVARCERSMGLHHSMGKESFTKSSTKSLCWYLRAYEHSHSTGDLSSINGAKQSVMLEFGDVKLAEFLSQFNSNMDCDTAKIE